MENNISNNKTKNRIKQVFAFQDWQNVAFANNTKLQRLLQNTLNQLAEKGNIRDYLVFLDTTKTDKRVVRTLDDYVSVRHVNYDTKNSTDVRLSNRITKFIDTYLWAVPAQDFIIAIIGNDKDYISTMKELRKRGVEAISVKRDDQPIISSLASQANHTLNIVTKTTNEPHKQSTSNNSLEDQAAKIIIDELQKRKELWMATLGLVLKDKLRHYKNKSSLKYPDGNKVRKLSTFIQRHRLLKKKVEVFGHKSASKIRLL